MFVALITNSRTKHIMSAESYTTLAEYENALIVKAREQAQLEWKEVEKKQRLATIHQELGFKTLNELIKALQEIANGKKAVKGTGAKRVRITPEVAAQVKELKAQGKGPSDISRALGISVPSVYNVLKKG